MVTTFTGNLGFANPTAGDFNWDDELARNHGFNDVLNKVQNSNNRVVSGGEISDAGGLDINVLSGSALINNVVYSWVDSLLGATIGPPEDDYRTNWIYVDDSGTLTISTTPPTGNFVVLGIADVDQTSVLRAIDFRTLQTSSSEQLDAISNIFLSSADIVDVFIYDTSLDSDGGLWRKRCSHLSWYKEELNTSTRGKTREFPASTNIVAETSLVTLFDSTDPLLPMWRIHDFTGYTITSVEMLGSILIVGTTAGLYTFNYLTNEEEWHTTTSDLPIINDTVNAVVLTVLDNAPIDQDTGLSLVTVIVAVVGGFCVIHGKGGKRTLFSVTNGSGYGHLAIKGDILKATWATVVVDVGKISTVTVNQTSGVWKDYFISSTTVPSLYQSDSTINTIANEIFGYNDGLTFLKENPQEPPKGSVDYMTKDYRTGDLAGDIRLASLMNTNKAQSELLSDASFDDGTDWVDISTGSGTAVFGSGIATFVRVDSGNQGLLTQSIGTEVGKKYFLSVDYLKDTLPRIFIGTTSGGAEISQTTETSVIFTATTTTTFITLNVANTGTAIFKQLSVKQIEQIGTDITTEHVVNGTFDTDTTGWTDISTGSGVVTWQVAGNVSIERTSSADRGKLSQSISTVAGQNYKVNYTAVSGTLHSVLIGTSEGGFDIAVVDHIDSFTFKAVGTTTYIHLSNSSSGTSVFDNVSIKKIQNIAENGEFSSDRIWTKGTGWTIGSGVASCDGTQTASTFLTQAPTIVDDIKYLVIFTLSNYSAGTIRPVVGGDSSSTSRSANGTYSEVITSNGGLNSFIFSATSDFIGDIDNVELYVLDIPDRCVKNNPLRAVGIIDLIPVGPFTETVGFGGFDADNFIEQPYTSDLDIGTGDFTFYGFANPESVTTQAVFDKIDGAGRKLTFYFTSTEFRFYINGVQILQLTFTTPLKHELYFIRRESGTLSFWAGKTKIGEVADSTSITFTDVSLVFGKDGYDTIFIGVLSLWSFTATALSDEQIISTYNKEKYFFEPFAKTTIQGVSDNVNDIDVDSLTGITSIATDDQTTRIQDNSIVVDVIDTPSNIIHNAISTVKGRLLLSSDDEGYFTSPEINLREESVEKDKAIAILSTPPQNFEFVSGSTDHELELGWYPTHVYEGGLLQASTEYDIEFDGFKYHVVFGVATSSAVNIIAQRKV